MELGDLREQLENIDRELLTLVAKRQQLSSEIGKAKRAKGLAPRDYGQEKVVIQRARATAEKLGISAELAEQLSLILIRSSLTVQERDQLAAHGTGGGKRALVIGGGGKMGSWFVRFLDSQGFEVEVADCAASVDGFRSVADWRGIDLDHDIVVVATPLGVLNATLLEIAERKPTGLVFDIGSLKSPVRSGLQALVDAHCRVTSIHPMFGPRTTLLSGCHVIFVDVGVPDAVEEAERLFASTMATRVYMDLESHDRVIAYVLGLSHAVNIAFFTALAKSGEQAPRLAKVSSTTFEEQMRVAANVAGENPSLYFEIQALNDYGAESLAALESAVRELRAAVAARDERSFVELMRAGRAYLDAHVPR